MLGLRARRGPRPRFWRLLLASVRIAPATPAAPPVRGEASSRSTLLSLLVPGVRGRTSSFSTFFSLRLRFILLKNQQIKPQNNRHASMAPMMMPAVRVRRPPSLFSSSPSGGNGAAVPVEVSEVDEVVLMVIIVPLKVLVPGESKNDVVTVDIDMLTEVEVLVEASGVDDINEEEEPLVTVVATPLSR